VLSIFSVPTNTYHNYCTNYDLPHLSPTKAMADFRAPELPQALDINSKNPVGEGVWIGGGIGFRWDDSIHMQN